MSLVSLAAGRAMVFGLVTEVREKLLEVPSVGLLLVVLVPRLWVLRLVCAFRSSVPRLAAFELCRTFSFSCQGLARKWLSLPLLTETASMCAGIAMASETRTRIALLLKWLASTV